MTILFLIDDCFVFQLVVEEEGRIREARALAQHPGSINKINQEDLSLEEAGVKYKYLNLYLNNLLELK